MRAARLQAALDERVVVAEVLERCHVRDSLLAIVALRASPPAVATVTKEMRADRARVRSADHEGEVAAMRGVQPELLGKNAAGRNVSGKHDQAARLAVDAMHRPHRRNPPSLRLRTACHAPEAAVEVAADRIGHELLERGLHLPPAGGPGEFFVMSRGRQARRFVDHHHVVVDVDDAHIVGLRQRRRRHLEHLDDLALLEPAGRVGAHVAVHEHVPRPHQLLDRRPTRAVEPGPEEGRERLAPVGFGHVVDGACLAFHGASDDAMPGLPEPRLTRFSAVLDSGGRIVRPKPPSFFAS